MTEYRDVTQVRRWVQEHLAGDGWGPRERVLEQLDQAPGLPSTVGKDIDDVLHDLIAVWHDADGIDGIELHQFLGCTWEEYGAWFGPESKPLPERLHGYWRWLHVRVWTGES